MQTQLNTRTQGKGMGRRTIVDRAEVCGDATYHTPLAVLYYATGKIVELNDYNDEERAYIDKTFQGIKLQNA